MFRKFIASSFFFTFFLTIAYAQDMPGHSGKMHEHSGQKHEMKSTPKSMDEYIRAMTPADTTQ